MTEPGDGKLRVFIVSEEDPLYVIRFFEVFFAECPAGEIDLCGMTIDKPFHESLARTLQRMLAFYGLRDTVRQGLRFLGARVRGHSIRSLARAHGVPLLETVSVNDPHFLAEVRARRPDVIVSVAAPEIFGRELLSIPRLGCVNLHSGRLPDYRGMMPTFWQMLRGEPAVTITAHQMVPKLDAGDILATHAFPLQRRDCLDRVITGTKREAARLLIGVLEALRHHEARPVPLELARSAYYSFPRSSDVRAFRQLGHRML